MGNIRTTDIQRETVSNLRARLGEWGYFTCTVAKRFRHNRLDFVAVPKDEFRRKDILLVRPERRGLVSIRPYQRLGNYYHIRLRLKELHRKKGFLGTRWIDDQIGKGILRPDLWDSYISPHSMKEIETLSISLDRRPDKRPGQ